MFDALQKKLREKLVNWLIKEPAPEAIPPYDYERLRYEVRPGDVLLIEGRSRISNIIRGITQSPWTHAALYIGRFHDIEDHSLKKMISRQLKKRENVRLVIEVMLGKGTIVTPLVHYRHTHIRICRPTRLSPEDAQLVIAYAVNSLGKPYNVRRLLDLARFLLPWSILPRRWKSSLFRTSTGEIESGICSSMIADAFNSVQFPILPLFQSEQEGITVIKRNPHLYSPKDFDYSPYFEIIKCPTLSPEEERPFYRRMPWSTTAMHHDHGIVSTPSKKIEDKKANIFSRFSKKKSSTDSTEDENKSHTPDHPETD
ncbi:MAG: YiiX/YebB-like N1pC/P60 family cysteine hydrolase [Gammaproteobacteria bacterium]|nr:YiiX/YebB-like N1pC/P60 family cysteine hydrolase [Gammaproteobacteria bacterium]